jgi:hypothetical protein
MKEKKKLFLPARLISVATASVWLSVRTLLYNTVVNLMRTLDDTGFGMSIQFIGTCTIKTRLKLHG